MDLILASDELTRRHDITKIIVGYLSPRISPESVNSANCARETMAEKHEIPVEIVNIGVGGIAVDYFVNNGRNAAEIRELAKQTTTYIATSSVGPIVTSRIPGIETTAKVVGKVARIYITVDTSNVKTGISAGLVGKTSISLAEKIGYFPSRFQGIMALDPSIAQKMETFYPTAIIAVPDRDNLLAMVFGHDSVAIQRIK